MSMVTAAWFSVSRVSNSAHRAIVNARENKIRAEDLFLRLVVRVNPERSINCQARSVAKVVGLARAGLLTDALQSPQAFLELGYN